MDKRPDPIPHYIKEAVDGAIRANNPSLLAVLSQEEFEAVHTYLARRQAEQADQHQEIYENSEGELRSIEEIRTAEVEHHNLLWFNHLVAGRNRMAGDQARPDEWRTQISTRYAESVTDDPFQLGVIHGKAAALRWVLGGEWDAPGT